MSIKINKLKIEKLFDFKDIEWDLHDVNVLVGKNGSGKSTILNIIKALMIQEAEGLVNICGDSTLRFDNGAAIKHREIPLKTDQINSLLSQMQKILSQTNKGKSKSSDNVRLGNELKKISEVIKSIESGESNKVIKTGLFEVRRPVDDKENSSPIDGDVENKSIENNESGDGKYLIPFEYLSTINMSANSLNEVKSSDGLKTTVLDMEINKEVLRFNKLEKENIIKSKEIKTRFISSINSLFKDCEKEVVFEEAISFKSKVNNKNLQIKDLSSGERQLVYTLLKTSIAAQRNAILLMDEPEISLHLSWQEKLIGNLRNINPEGQIIIVTHSPAVVMDGWMNSYIDIKNIEKRL